MTNTKKRMTVDEVKAMYAKKQEKLEKSIKILCAKFTARNTQVHS